MAQRYSHRRPRYYDDEESDKSDVDNYSPRRPYRSDRNKDGDRNRDDRRPPPPPEAMPPPPVRRPSILVDPEETPSERERRRPRANSNVRLQTSDDDDNDDPRSRGGVRSRRAPAPPKDLEAKNGDEYRRFRQKRDGYESDEGKMHRKAKNAPPQPQPRGYPDDNDDDYRRPKRAETSLPVRGKPRDPVNGVEYGGAAIPTEDRGIQRRRTYKEPSARETQGYDDYGSPRRAERRRTANFDDPGYRSDNAHRAPPPRQSRPRRDYDDDYEVYDRPQPRRRPPPVDEDRGYRSGGDRAPRPRPQDYYSDYREDRAPRRGDPRRYPRDDRDRYAERRRDDPYGDRARSSKKSGGTKDWQKEAGAAFMTYAMPTLKKEGTRFVKKELQKFLSSRGGGGL
jgi:hypothetical protein